MCECGRGRRDYMYNGGALLPLTPAVCVRRVWRKARGACDSGSCFGVTDGLWNIRNFHNRAGWRVFVSHHSKRRSFKIVRSFVASASHQPESPVIAEGSRDSCV